MITIVPLLIIDNPDTTTHIVGGWREKAEQGSFSKDQVAPIPLIDQMVAEKRLGRKSGRGFYDVSLAPCGGFYMR